MLYSPKQRFIFIKSSKTAGTSIEIALSRHLREADDVITPLGSNDELLRLVYGGTAPRNCFCKNDQGHRKLVRNLRIALLGIKLGNREADPRETILKTLEERHSRQDLALRNHISVDVVIDYIGLEQFSNSFSCGFVREPSARAISQFFWRNRGSDFSNYTANDLNRPFIDFLSNKYRSLQSQLQGVRHKSISTKAIYRFEDLYASYIDICDHLGVPEHERLSELPSAKVNTTSSEKPGFSKEQLLTNEAREIIHEKCAWEYENFYPQ